MNAMSANFLKTLDMTGHSKDDIVHGGGPKPMNTRQGDKGPREHMRSLAVDVPLLKYKLRSRLMEKFIFQVVGPFLLGKNPICRGATI